jgi:hypothetical protein
MSYLPWLAGGAALGYAARSGRGHRRKKAQRHLPRDTAATFTLKAGTRLYHGTNQSHEVKSLRGPAWLAWNPREARWFATSWKRHGGEPRILTFVVTRPLKLLHQRDQEDSTHDLLYRALESAGMSADEWSDFVYEYEGMPWELWSDTKFDLAGYRPWRKAGHERDLAVLAEWHRRYPEEEPGFPPEPIEDFWTRNRIDSFTRALEVACKSSDFDGYIQSLNWWPDRTRPRGAELLLCDPSEHLKRIEVTPL